MHDGSIFDRLSFEDFDTEELKQNVTEMIKSLVEMYELCNRNLDGIDLKYDYEPVVDAYKILRRQQKEYARSIAPKVCEKFIEEYGGMITEYYNKVEQIKQYVNSLGLNISISELAEKLKEGYNTVSICAQHIPGLNKTTNNTLCKMLNNTDMILLNNRARPTYSWACCSMFNENVYAESYKETLDPNESKLFVVKYVNRAMKSHNEYARLLNMLSSSVTSYEYLEKIRYEYMWATTSHYY
jgi:hypothetical protein